MAIQKMVTNQELFEEIEQLKETVRTLAAINDRAYKAKSAAKVLDIGLTTMKKLIRDGKIRTHKKEGGTFILHSDLIEYVKN